MLPRMIDVTCLMTSGILKVAPVTYSIPELTSALKWATVNVGDLGPPIIVAEEDDAAIVLRCRSPVVDGILVLRIKSVDP